jgi:hypothetical protein
MDVPWMYCGYTRDILGIGPDSQMLPATNHPSEVCDLKQARMGQKTGLKKNRFNQLSKLSMWNIVELTLKTSGKTQQI